MFILVIFLFIFAILLVFLKKRRIVEKFSNSMVTYFKIKIGIFKEPNFDFHYKYLKLLSSDIPLEVVQFNNKYEPFYELKKRNIDFVLSSERDYMIYHINQTNKKSRALDSFRKIPKIQLITAAYHIYFLLVADFDKITNYDNINDKTVQINPKRFLGLDVEYELFQNYKVHFKHRNDDLPKAYDDIGNKSSILLHTSVHPNKLLLEKSNEKEIYLLDSFKVNQNTDFFNKFLFVNKTQIDLQYYPKILQRTTSNEIGYKLNTYSTRAILLGLDVLNDKYVYEFMKVYFKKIDDIRNKYPYYNNFRDSEISYSRLSLENRVLSFHNGARDFYRRIGNFTYNPDRGCAVISNECTNDQLQQFGDYLQW